MLYSNVWNRYSALLYYHYYYIIYHNIYLSLTRVYRLWNSSVSLLALQIMPERQSNIWRYLQTIYISVFSLLLSESISYIQNNIMTRYRLLFEQLRHLCRTFSSLKSYRNRVVVTKIKYKT